MKAGIIQSFIQTYLQHSKSCAIFDGSLPENHQQVSSVLNAQYAVIHYVYFQGQ